MLVLSNSLTPAADEGSLKLASGLVKGMKERWTETYVVSFERECPFSDAQMELNRFHLSPKLISLLRKQTQPVLYLPFPAPVLSMAVRIFLLSRFAKRGLWVGMIRQYPMNLAARWLLKVSRANLVVFSSRALAYYRQISGGQVRYLKTGVDTNKFVPVSRETARSLKIKYGFDPEKPLILHVGHMKAGRNVAELMKIQERCQVLLVISTQAKERQDPVLRERLEGQPNIRVLDQYLPHIEEIYQMCDAYFFPVRKMGHCIDVPLSCLEAAACNKPVITTDFGEMQELIGKPGFYFLKDLEAAAIQKAVDWALGCQTCHSREAVMEYDRGRCLDALRNLLR